MLSIFSYAFGHMCVSFGAEASPSETKNALLRERRPSCYFGGQFTPHPQMTLGHGSGDTEKSWGQHSEGNTAHVNIPWGKRLADFNSKYEKH